MLSGIFITGTDTGIGKTSFTLALMQTLKTRGYQVGGMKPIASGAKWINGKLINEDAQLIKQCCSSDIDYDLVNPFVFEQPVAPHIAADNESMVIDIKKIVASYKQISSMNDITIVEGVGGWRVPVSANSSLADIVSALKLPVILIVGLKLGCINHALLSAEAIYSDGVDLYGWVSNQIEKDYMYKDKTLETLFDRLASSHIVDLPYMPGFVPDKLSTYLKAVKLQPVKILNKIK